MMEDDNNGPATAPQVAPTQAENWEDSLYEYPVIKAGFRVNVFSRLFFDERFKDPNQQNLLFGHLEHAAFTLLNEAAILKVIQFSEKPILGVNRQDQDKLKNAKTVLEHFQQYKKDSCAEKVPMGCYLYKIGLSLQEGKNGVVINLANAEIYLLRGIEYKDFNAFLSLGLIHYLGSATCPKDIAKAEWLWKKSEQLGNKNAIGNLATLYFEAGDIEKAIMYFKKDSDNGNVQSTLNLASLYFNGHSQIPVNHKLALEYFLKAYSLLQSDYATKLKVANHIGCIYFNGTHQNPNVSNYEEARKWFMQAGIDSADIQVKIGKCHDRLNNPKKAFHWLTQAARQNHPLALLLVGNAHYFGKGTKKDLLKAAASYKQSAKLGEPVGCHNYATTLFEQKNPALETTIIYYFTQAAEKNYCPSILTLAEYYLSQSHKNPEALAKAFFWINKAQELSDPKAQTLFEAATKKEQENAAEDQALVTCVESLQDAQVETASLGELSLSSSVAEDRQGSLTDASSSESDEEEAPQVEPSHEISPDEIQDWEAEQTRWKSGIKNPKFIREKLRAAREVFERAQIAEEKPALTPHSQKILADLKGKETRTAVTIEDLKSLVKDPHFQGQIDMFNTTDGYAIVAHNFATSEAFSVGNHRKHNKSFKGLDRNFLKDTVTLLEKMGV